MTDIKFDQDAATALASSSRKAATVLKDEGTVRSGAVETASDGFTGPYKNSFDKVCGTEETDRKNLKSALETLAKKVEETATKAAEEKKRLKEMRAWEQRRDAGVPTGYLKEVSCYGPLIYQNPPNYCPADPRTGKQPSKIIVSVTTDPEPSRIPILPPSMEVSFSAQTRDRSASGAKGSDKVSAKPAKLDEFVTKRTSSDKTIGDAITNLQSSWSNFTSKCSWANFADVNIFSGISTYQEENQADRTWVAGIADSFRKAGSGKIDVVDIQVHLAGKDPRYKDEAKRSLNDPNLTKEELYETVKRLANIPGNENVLGEIAKESLDNAKKTKSDSDIERATTLLNGISTNAKASAAAVQKIGGTDIVNTVALAASWANRGQEVALDLAKALRSVFRTGEPALAQINPEASRKLAQDLANFVTTHSTSNHPYNRNYALSYLLRESNLSTEFLNELGKHLDQYERSQGKGVDIWSPNGTWADGGTLLFDNKEDKEIAFDVMASFMSALERNGSASLQFFTGTAVDLDTIEGYELTTKQALERQRYWLQNRSWSHDKFTSLFGALNSATTSNETRRSATASSLVSSIFEMLATRTRGTDYAGNRVISHNENEKILPSSLSTAATVSLANIVGAYTDAIDYYSNRSKTNSDSLSGKIATLSRADLQTPNAPMLDIDDIEILLTAGFGSEEGYASLRHALTRYQQNHIREISNQITNPQDLDRAIKQGTYGSASLEAIFMKSLTNKMKLSGINDDHLATSWIDPTRRAISATLSPLTAPIPPAQYLIDFALDKKAEELQISLTVNENDAILKGNKIVHRALEDRKHGLLKDLYETGYVTMEDIHEAGKMAGLSTQKVEKLFSGGKFPSNKDFNSDTEARSLIDCLSDYKFNNTSFEDAYYKTFNTPVR